MMNSLQGGLPSHFLGQNLAATLAAATPKTTRLDKHPDGPLNLSKVRHLQWLDERNESPDERNDVSE